MSEPSELPPMAGAPLSVLLLGGGDAVLAAEVAAEWEAELQKLGKDYEVLVIAANGPNDLPVPLKTLADPEPRVRHLSYPGSPGLGAALRTGLAAARHPLLF